MTINQGSFTAAHVEEIESAIKQGVLSPVFPFSEYRLFSSDQLHAHFIHSLRGTAAHDALYVKISEGTRQAWAILSFSEYDSAVFGFRAYTLGYVVVSQGFTLGLTRLFEQLASLARQQQIGYITLSVNTNDPQTPLIVNHAIRAGFYYINTLITFGFTQQNYPQLDLNYTCDRELVIRLSKPEDFDSLYQIAQNSYQINRFHLDPHLPRDKCDLLHAESLRNSFFHGFVDRIFVAEYRGQPIGYFSGKVKLIPDLGVRMGIGVISAVSSEYRRLGAFQAMNKALIQSLNADSDFSEWGTYINNQPVHSVYIKSKMRLIRGMIQMGFYNVGS